MNSTIASAITDSVIKLLNHSTDLVRKKSVLLLQKIVTNALYRKVSMVDKCLNTNKK